MCITVHFYLHIIRKAIAVDKANYSVEGILNIGHCLVSIERYVRFIANCHKFDDFAIFQ